MINDILDTTLYILQGLSITLKVYFVTFIFSLPLGMIIASVHANGNIATKRIIDTYTWLLRGTPLLLQLYFVMYGLPLYGFRMSREMVAYVTFTINYAAYFTEIIRGGIESVDQGQYDAAKTLGLKRTQTFIRIVLPQSLKRVLPSITNEGITLVKDTALVAAIALGDVLRNTKEVVSRTMNPSAYIITALIYLTLSYVIVKAFKKIEKRYAYYR